jgi:hypothetical protein
MNRRESLKAITLGTLSTGVLLEACSPEAKEADTKKQIVNDRPDRLATEIEREKKLNEETFFTPHEFATISILSDIIIPSDEHSGSASDAGVADFIEFMAKDRPENQVPLRGGLRWLDLQCFKRYKHSFKDCSLHEQLEIVEEIAYPESAKPAMKQGVAFFDRMRSLTATGFFSSKIGVQDLGYVGNRPNKWEGVPPDIIKQYGLENVRF